MVIELLRYLERLIKYLLLIHATLIGKSIRLIVVDLGLIPGRVRRKNLQSWYSQLPCVMYSALKG